LLFGHARFLQKIEENVHAYGLSIVFTFVIEFPYCKRKRSKECRKVWLSLPKPQASEYAIASSESKKEKQQLKLK